MPPMLRHAHVLARGLSIYVRTPPTNAFLRSAPNRIAQQYLPQPIVRPFGLLSTLTSKMEGKATEKQGSSQIQPLLLNSSRTAQKRRWKRCTRRSPATISSRWPSILICTRCVGAAAATPANLLRNPCPYFQYMLKESGAKGWKQYIPGFGKVEDIEKIKKKIAVLEKIPVGHHPMLGARSPRRHRT